MNRRGFLKAILATACAPAIVKASSIMTLRPMDQAIVTLDGWMSDLRITNGVARYTSNFTITDDDLIDPAYNKAFEEVLQAEDRNWKQLGEQLAREIALKANRPGMVRRFINGRALA